MQLAGNVAVITGGASGLGAATARLFAGAGAKLALWDLNAEAGNALAAEFGSNGLFVKTDVTSSDDVQRALTQVQEQFGRLHLVINCAGIGTAERVVGRQGPLPLERFERVIQINLIGTFNVIRLAAALMMQNTPNAEGERGVIINTASVAGLVGTPGMPAYVASKHAVIGLTKVAAGEVARQGIRVNCVCPGPVDTRMIHDLEEQLAPGNPASVGERYRSAIPSGRYTTADEVANLVIFLCSDLSSNTTGGQFVVDGGRTATGGALTNLIGR